MSNQRIIPINIEEEMKSAYIDYSMSVIVSRALPDVRDGLKPVHRRVLYGMSELGLNYNKAHKKSARIVGEVLGKYHPHGDTSVYDTMVRMAQDWSLRYPLVDGQGNFGSMDGDSPAAMRYTEARLRRISDDILTDLGKDTVDFALNFDDTLQEPTVLPTKIPNLLVNGASGIAVGMATNMLPHNLSEVIDGIIATVDQPDITIEGLMEYVKGPDFPTGGTIYGYEGVKDALETGRGRIVVRGKARIENSGNRETIIIYEVPYQVNKANLVAKISDLVNEKKIEGISNVGDESSSRDGIRVVIDVKRDAMASVVLSNLYKYTPLQTSYGVNNVALVKGRPMTLNLKDIIEEFIDFRQEVIVRRTRYELRKALQKAHILVGLLVALDYIDAVISLIRNSKTVEEARAGLKEGAFIDDMKAFQAKFDQIIAFSSVEDLETHIVADGEVLSEAQARAILDMRLQKLTGLERDKVQGEYDELQKVIEGLRAILDSEELQRTIIKEELSEIKERFGDERRTDITYADGEISIEDLIKDEEMVITISHLGYIKRTSASEYRTQSRGGRGAKGSNTRDADFIEHMFIATTHNYLLLFTEKGKCHWIRVYQIPEASRTSSGRVIQNLMEIPKDDKVKAYIIIKDLKDEDFVDNHYILFCTKKGLVKKTPVQAFSRPRNGGIIAININEADQLLEAKLTTGNSQVLIANKGGNAIRFDEEKVRSMGRSAAGVRGISLTEAQDEVVGMVVVASEENDKTILVVSEKGNGKRSAVEEYRLTNRGGKGVKTMQVTDKTGAVIAMKAVSEEDDLMITNRSGIVIRMAVNDIRVMGRATQGVRVIRLDDDDDIADVAVVRDNGAEDDVEIEATGDATDQDTTDTEDTTTAADD
ncbi:MAG: DNA gyrase subunit A [Bacteroidota bacterium]